MIASLCCCCCDVLVKYSFLSFSSSYSQTNPALNMPVSVDKVMVPFWNTQPPEERIVLINYDYRNTVSVPISSLVDGFHDLEVGYYDVFYNEFVVNHYNLDHSFVYYDIVETRFTPTIRGVIVDA